MNNQAKDNFVGWWNLMMIGFLKIYNFWFVTDGLKRIWGWKILIEDFWLMNFNWCL